MAEVVINPRFAGFPDIALGGYVGGILALDRTKAEVSLRRPVRVGRPCRIEDGPDGTTTLYDGDEVLAFSKASAVDLQVPQPVGLEESKAASQQYLGHRRHLVPNCFNCGPLRQEGDGLRIFPGRVAGRDVVSAPWVPSESLADSSGAVRPEFIWSALDCPTIWALVLQGRPDSVEKAVTARLAVELVSPIRADVPQIVGGWKVSETGRTRVAGGVIYSVDGQTLAKARHTLVTADWGVPMGLNSWQ